MSSAMFCYYLFATANIGLGALGLIFRKATGQFWFWAVFTLFWACQLGGFFTEASIYSLSGIPAICGIGALIVCLCQLVTLAGDRQTVRPLVNTGFLVVLVIISLFPEEVRHDSFMMTYIFAILFFLSRPLALGLTLYALAGLIHVMRDDSDRRLLVTSKSAAFLATICFLGGEIVGCYWGFMGWGTTWRWSGNFQFSAMLFVLFMVSFHIPRTLFATRKSYTVAFSAPLALIALCILLDKII